MASSRTNYTIDDSQWASTALQLSEGWNMLRIGGSNEYIDPAGVEIMRPLLPNFWNGSVSWTTLFGASTTLNFTGTDIRAYGMSGPAQGRYIVELDNRVIGNFTAVATAENFHYALFEAHGLNDTVPHSLTLRNNQGGASLAFDYLEIGFAPLLPSVATTSLRISSSSTLSSSSSFTRSSGIATGNITVPAIPTPTSTTKNATTGPYSPAQLASLTTPYTFQWNNSAYFVVVLASLLGASGAFFCLWALWGAFMSQRQKKPKEGESYFRQSSQSPLRGAFRRPRPTTKVLSALRGMRIGHPMPTSSSADGHADVDALSYRFSDRVENGDHEKRKL